MCVCCWFSEQFIMKITFLQCVLAGAVSLLAIFWMRTVILYALLICTILVFSWLLGLTLYLKFSHIPADAHGSASVSDSQHSLLDYIMVGFIFVIT